MPIYYTLGTHLAKLCFTAFAKWEVSGREAVPPQGPLVVVSNHLSIADPPILVASIPRQLRFVAKRSLFQNPVGAHFLTRVGTHPVDRNGMDLDALHWNLSLLQRDQTVLLFPEGKRSHGEGMRRGQPGAAYIAARSQAPILPVGITGTEKIKEYWRLPFPLCHIKITIGEPFTLPSIEGKLSRPILQHMADMIMGRVAALLPRDYKGYYATQEADSMVTLDSME